MSARSALSAPPRRTRSPPMPTWCLPSARGCRISSPARGPSSAPTPASSRLNAARFDAVKHRALSVVGDARSGDRGTLRRARRLAGAGWLVEEGHEGIRRLERHDRQALGPTNAEVPSYAQVVGAINRICAPTDLALTAAGGLPGELCQELARQVGRHLRLRVRLLLHGLRDRRRLGRQDGGPGRAMSSP